jgi:hypothetical protein
MDAAAALEHILVSGIERKRIFYGNSDHDNSVARLTAILPENTAKVINLWTSPILG